MTKMQIVAKTVLIILGIYAVITLCYYLSMLQLIQSTRSSTFILFFAVLAIITTAIVFFVIFKNDNSSRKMAGDGEELNPTNEAIWLAASLRLGAVLCGLILLSTSIPTILSILLSPIYIRTLVNEIFLFEGFPKLLMFPLSKWLTMIYNFAKAVLAIYLLCGAPQFIRWQLKHSTVHRQPNTGKIETTNFPITNSERPSNE